MLEVTNNDSKEAIVIIFNKVKYNNIHSEPKHKTAEKQKQKKNQMEIPELKN